MNKFRTYFGQIITDAELNEIFDSFASAIEQFIQDFNYRGLAIGGEVVQNPVPSLNVLVNGPLVAYDQSGNRIVVGSPQTVNCAIDENNLSTAVQGPLNEKYISVFVGFQSIPTDPREDELGVPKFFRYVGSYKFYIAQASEAPLGTAPRPALRGDLVLLADIRRVANQTTILTSDISTTRSQVIFDLPGVPLALHEKGLKPALQGMLSALNSISTDTLLLPAIPGSPTSLPAGSVRAVITAFLAAFNALRSQVGGLPQNLNNVAFVNQANTFTQDNTLAHVVIHDQVEFDNDVVDRAPISITNGAGASKWKKLADIRWGGSAAGGQYIRIFSGSDGDKGCFVIPVNAAFNFNPTPTSGDPNPPPRWEKRDNALVATAIIWTYRRVRLVSIPVGTNNWVDWPNDLAPVASSDMGGAQIVGSASVSKALFVGENVDVGGDLNVDDATVRGNLSVAGAVSAPDGTVDVNGHLTISGNLTAKTLKLVDADSITYASPVNRGVIIDLSTGISENSDDQAKAWRYDHIGGFNDRWTSVKQGMVVFPIRLPKGARINGITAQFLNPVKSDPYDDRDQLHFYLLQGEWGELPHTGIKLYGDFTGGEPAYAATSSFQSAAVVNCKWGDTPNGMLVNGIDRIRLFVQNPYFGNGDAHSNSDGPYILNGLILFWTDAGPSSLISG